MKRILAVVLTLAMLVLPVLAAPENCEHELMHMRNDACHYDECTVCFELFNVGDHTMKDGVCTVCNYPEEAPWEEEIRGEGQHEHIFNKTADEETHYEECTVCLERFGVGEHTFENGVCTVCGYSVEDKPIGEHEHKLMKMANMNCHYEECTICFELFNVSDHTFENGKCTVCGHDELINPFVDVKESAWYHDEIVKAVATEIINGKTKTEFKPDDLLTYAEALKLAACMRQKYDDGKVTLKNGSPWYQTYVDYCKEKKIISREFAYTENATRAGYMEIFANALPEEAFEEVNSIPDGSILDVKSSATYAHYVYKLYRAGIVTGVDKDHNCNPEANIKRSEVAVIIARMMDSGERVEFSMGGDVEINEKDTVEVTGCKHDFVIKHDEDFHWEQCIPCEECRNEEEHTFKDGVCKVCGYKKQEKPDGEMTVPDKVEIPDNYEAVVIVPEKDKDSFKYEDKYLIEEGEITGIYIEKQPVSIETEGYMSPGTLEVKANGGRRPYTYQWKYRQGRGDTYEVVDTFNVKGAQTDKLTIYTNPNDKHTGLNVYCTVTDADGNTVNSTAAAVYGPFSMKIEQRTLAGTGIYELVGRLDDGMLKPDESVAIKRGDKIIAVGIVKEMKMFGKNIDVVTKGDYCGIIFRLDDGYTPVDGDIVLRYQDYFEIDGSDIVN